MVAVDDTQDERETENVREEEIHRDCAQVGSRDYAGEIHRNTLHRRMSNSDSIFCTCIKPMPAATSNTTVLL